MDPEFCPLMGGKSTILMASEYGGILHQASKFGDEEKTEQILRSYPFLVHEINMKGDTPLHIAARSGNLGVAKLLITCAKTKEVKSGMHTLRMRNKKKLTVLQEAVQNDHYEVVDLLIKEDPGLTCTTDDGVESPLFMAVEGRFYQIAHRILETFPNCALSGRRGMTVMHAAVIGLPNYSLGPLGYEIWNSCLPFFEGREGLSLQFMVKVLERIGPEILEVKDEFGWIPLHYAAYIGNEEVVELFLETNSYVAYIKNKQGMSALHISAQEGRIGVIKILMQKCPNVCELLEMRVSEEARMEQLHKEKVHESPEDTELHVFAHDDKAAGRPRDTSITTGKKDESEYIKNVADVNLIVATIITSITFAALFSMPGGYDNKNGMPILRKILSFRFSLVTNSLAFGFATSSMFIHFWGLFFPRNRYPIRIVSFLTVFSLFCALSALLGVIWAVFTGEKNTTEFDKLSWLPLISLYSFIIPIYFFLYSHCFWFTPAYMKSVFVEIVEKCRRKEKK